MTQEGRVIKSTGSWYIVRSSDLSVTQCRLPGKLRLESSDQTNPVAVGDEVTFDKQADQTGTIRKIHKRRNMITRQATHGRRGQQVMAANIDLAICVQSYIKPEYKTGFIDRFLITAEANHVRPLILINKLDLADQIKINEVQNLQKMYEKLGYDLITCSIYLESSILKLKSIIKNQTIMFMGPSGTGKTSLLNVLNPGLNHSVAEVSDFSNKGKHTTTYAELIELPGGGYIVDTPGIRELGLVDIEASDLSNFYSEMRFLRESCKYYNCSHVHEPDCAVQRAYEKGEIAPSRYLSYLQILESL